MSVSKDVRFEACRAARFKAALLFGSLISTMTTMKRSKFARFS